MRAIIVLKCLAAALACLALAVPAAPAQCPGACSGQGVCVGTQCACNVGFTGAACQFSNLVTCNGHGVATFAGGCNCFAGYVGPNCTLCGPNYYNYPACTFCLAATTCGGHGNCTGSGACACLVGYVGANCAQCAPGYTGYPSCQRCTADFNSDGSVGVGDLFDFLAAYFSGSPSANVNGTGGLTVQDIFDFLAMHFTPCP